MPPMPNKLIVPVRNASADGRYWGRYPAGDRPGQAAQLVGDAAAIASGGGTLSDYGVLPLYTMGSPSAGMIGGAPTYAGAWLPNNGEDYNGITAACFEDRCIIGKGAQSNQFFVTGKQQGSNSGPAIMRVTRPALYTGSDVSGLNIATLAETFRLNTPVNGAFGDPRILGISIIDGQVVVGAVSWYDTLSRPENYAIYRDANNLAGAQAGMFRMTGGRHNAGWVIPIPAAFQAALGATHLAGHGGGVSIESTTVSGVSMYAVNGADILAATAPNQVIAATVLADYQVSGGAGMAGPLATTPMWNWLSICGGIFFVPGTRSILGLGRNWDYRINRVYNERIFYKTEDTPSGHGTDETGEAWSNGYFPYPEDGYANYYWIWDVDRLIEVKNGTRAPNEVLPREHGFVPVALPFSAPRRGRNLIGSCAWDDEVKRPVYTLQSASGSRFGPYISAAVAGELSLAGVS